MTITAAAVICFAIVAVACYEAGRLDGRADADAEHCAAERLAAVAEAGSRLRHPTALGPKPLTGQDAVDEWLRQHPPGGAR